MARLGDVVDFYSGGTPSKSSPELWDGGVPWFSAKDIKKPRLEDSADHVAEDVFTKTRLRRLPAGTLVMVVRGMILAHTVPISVLDVEATINQDLKALIPREEVDPTFLAAMLQAQHSSILAQVSTAAHGTTKLETRVLENVQVPLPPIDEQRRIAAILDHADALRAKRRQVLAHLDDLTQSIFHDMFGDPESWSGQVPFGDVVTLTGGRNLVADDSSADSEFRVLKISAVTTGRFKPGESKALPDGYVPPPEHMVRRGDLLMSRANTTDLVGAVALVDGDPDRLVLPDKVWRFNWHDPESEPLFFHSLLRTPSMRRQISRLSSGTGGSMKNVSKSKLNRMLVPMVVVGDQRRFVAKVDAAAHIYWQQLEASRALDELFASLQSRAFKGEL